MLLSFKVVFQVCFRGLLCYFLKYYFSEVTCTHVVQKDALNYLSNTFSFETFKTLSMSKPKARTVKNFQTE